MYIYMTTYIYKPVTDHPNVGPKWVRTARGTIGPTDDNNDGGASALVWKKSPRAACRGPPALAAHLLATLRQAGAYLGIRNNSPPTCVAIITHICACVRYESGAASGGRPVRGRRGRRRGGGRPRRRRRRGSHCLTSERTQTAGAGHRRRPREHTPGCGGCPWPAAECAPRKRSARVHFPSSCHFDRCPVRKNCGH